MIFISTILFAASILLFFHIFRNRREALNLPQFASAVFLFTYGLSTAYVGINSEKVIGMLLSINGTSGAGVSTSLTYVLLFCIALAIIGKISKNWTSISPRRLLLRHRSSFNWLFLMTGIVLVAEIHLIRTGQYGATWIEIGGGKLPPLAYLITPFQFSVFGLWGANISKLNRFRLSRWWIILLVLHVASVALIGRRTFSYSLISFVFCYLLTSDRVNWKATTILTSLFLIMSSVSFYFFMCLRMASWEMKDSSPIETMTEAVSIAVSGENRSGLSAFRSLSENVESRPFIVGYLSNLTKSDPDKSGSQGRIITSAIGATIPRFLLPDKDKFSEGADEERMAQIYLGTSSSNDEANSIFTASFTDFKWTGIWIYPPLFSFYLTSFCLFEKYIKGPFGGYILSYIIWKLLNVELSTTSYMNAIRECFFISLISLMIFLIHSMIHNRSSIPIRRFPTNRSSNGNIRQPPRSARTSDTLPS